jgi:hypothetical protein
LFRLDLKQANDTYSNLSKKDQKKFDMLVEKAIKLCKKDFDKLPENYPDVAYDRTTMRRVRKILDRAKPGCLIDFHTWNHMDERAGFCSNANLYGAFPLFG